MDVCEPFMDVYFRSLELEGKPVSPSDYYELWRLGSIAWNMANKGLKDANDFLNDDSVKIEDKALLFDWADIITKMIQRKNELYPRLTVVIKKIVVEAVGEDIKLSVNIGSDFESDEDNQVETAPEEIPAERTETKQTQMETNPNSVSKSDSGKQDNPPDKEENCVAIYKNDIEVKLEEFDSLATETQTRLKKIVSLLESKKVPSVEETNALDQSLEELRIKYEDFVAFAKTSLLEEEMPPEGSGLEQYRTAIENSSAAAVKQKIEDARIILSRFTRIRGKVIDYSTALKSYQDKATELLKSLSEEKIDEITSGTVAPEIFLNAFDAETVTLPMLEEVSKYYSQYVQWGLAGNQYYEDTFSYKEDSNDSAESSQEATPSSVEATESDPQMPQENDRTIAISQATVSERKEISANSVEPASDSSEKEEPGVSKKTAKKASKHSAKKLNQINENKEDLPVEENPPKRENPIEELTPDDASEHGDDSKTSDEENLPVNETESKLFEEDDSFEGTSPNEAHEENQSREIDPRSILEQKDAPSDEEFCFLISKHLNKHVSSQEQLQSIIVESVLLANGASLLKDRPNASKYSAQLKLATHLLLGDIPYSSEQLTSTFPNQQNENKALLLSAYLFAMLNPAGSHDNTLWTQAKSYFNDYDICFEGFEAFKSLFNKLMSIKDFGTGFSPNLIASLGSAAEIDARIKELEKKAKEYLVLQRPNIQIKSLPKFYGKCFGPGSSLHNCMSIIAEGKKEKGSIETVEKELAKYCDKQDVFYSINDTKIENIIDDEWDTIIDKDKEKSTFKLDYRGRDQAFRQFKSRLELMRSWFEQMNYANKEQLSRMHKLKKSILEICESIQKDRSWENESFANVLSWLLSYMTAYLKGEISDLHIYSDLLLTGIIPVKEDGTPNIISDIAFPYFEPWRNALRHILADKKKIDDVKADILGNAINSSDDKDGLKDNFHQLEMLGKYTGDDDNDYVITESQLNAAINYANGNVVEFKEKLELAYTYGKINESEKDTLSKQIEVYKEIFYDLKDFAIWRRFLDALTKQIRDCAEERILSLREKIIQRLKDNPNTPILIEASRLLEEEQNLAVAEEYLNRFDAGQTNLSDVNLLLHDSMYFEDFLKNEDDLFEESRKHIKLWNSKDCPDDFEQLIENWPTRKSDTIGKQIANLFEYLGFSVDHKVSKEPNSKVELYNVTIEPTPKYRADYIHPIAAFGTQLKSPIKVIVADTRHNPQGLVDTVTTKNLRGLPIVLIDKSYTAADRRQIGESFHTKSTGQNPFLLVDRVLLLFLAMHQITERIPVLLNCTLPYTTYQPFVRDGGSIPDEMFFGRTLELNTISDPNGACVVYGGRQLGKTALLERVESLRSIPKENKFAVYSSIFGLKEEEKVVATLIRDILRKAEGKIKLRNCTSIQELCDQLNDLFSKKTIVTMHLLIDEVDDFLDAIADQAYAPLQPFVSLKSATKNNFKFVIAGLHNVCRAENATKQNGLFGQLGTPLCIKPLSPIDALNLLSRPLSYLGFQIDRNKLETFLTNTNYYPGILQFFGYMLVQTLTGEYQKYYRAATGNPPFTLRDDQLGSVMNSADLNKSIKDKIRLTLELDPRYFMLARCIAYLHHLEKGSYRDFYGFEMDKIIQIVNAYEIHCLKNEKPNAIRNLLAEMEDMGILSQSDGKYRLRKGSFVDIIGESGEAVERDIKQNNLEV